MTTKENIIEQALRLFSAKGFEAVSVRDIARAVGIKESSLYYHFKNKQDIFDTIVDACFEKANGYFRGQSLPFAIGDDISMYRGIDLDTLTGLIFSTFGYFFDDPYNVMFRRLLTVSQFENEKARRIYRQLYREYPITFQTGIFEMLMKAGEFREENPAVVAMEFYSVPFMLIHTCDSLEEAKPALKEHVRQFVRNYHV